MSLNDTVSAERVHIGFFGKRNAGKSSVVNAVTGQQLAVVSDVKGTTTDPVRKAMELLPLGPVVIFDTPGLDDEGELGELRVKKSREVLAHTDIALLVVDATEGISYHDTELLTEFESRKIPFIIVMNKTDLLTDSTIAQAENTVLVSALTGQGISELKDKIAALGQKFRKEKFIVKDLVEPGDVVILVIPIDESAPKGRIILPQQQVLRELLDLGCSALCCQPNELEGLFGGLFAEKRPSLVITDSQAFEEVAKKIPQEVPLTSFSILFARYKGNLEVLMEGAKTLAELKDGDKVLIAEGCTHHRQCNDLGTVKMPGWICAHAGANGRPEGAAGEPLGDSTVTGSAAGGQPVGDSTVDSCEKAAPTGGADGADGASREGVFGVAQSDAAQLGSTAGQPCGTASQSEGVGSTLGAAQADGLNCEGASDQPACAGQPRTVASTLGAAQPNGLNCEGTSDQPACAGQPRTVAPEFSFVSGGEFPDYDELVAGGYKLIVHCGGCMLNEAEVRHRMAVAKRAHVPMVNYGIAIAEMKGILSRAIAPVVKANAD